MSIYADASGKKLIRLPFFFLRFSCYVAIVNTANVDIEGAMGFMHLAGLRRICTRGRHMNLKSHIRRASPGVDPCPTRSRTAVHWIAATHPRRVKEMGLDQSRRVRSPFARLCSCEQGSCLRICFRARARWPPTSPATPRSTSPSIHANLRTDALNRLIKTFYFSTQTLVSILFCFFIDLLYHLIFIW